MAQQFRNKASLTPLHEASTRGHWHSDIILLLLEHKADADALDGEQATPLYRAALEGKLEATQLLSHDGATSMRVTRRAKPQFSWPLQKDTMVSYGCFLSMRKAEHRCSTYKFSALR